MSHDSVICSSGQTWKLALGLIVMLGGFALTGVALLWLPRSTHSLELAVSGMLAGLLVLFATCWSICCPACGARWMWIALSEQDCLHWLDWLLAQRACARCGEFPRTSHSKGRTYAE